jgi:hypothetical protein
MGNRAAQYTISPSFHLPMWEGTSPHGCGGLTRLGPLREVRGMVRKFRAGARDNLDFSTFPQKIKRVSVHVDHPRSNPSNPIERISSVRDGNNNSNRISSEPRASSRGKLYLRMDLFCPCAVPFRTPRSRLAGPAIMDPVSELAFWADRRRDEAEAIYRRTDHRGFERG